MPPCPYPVSGTNRERQGVGVGCLARASRQSGGFQTWEATGSSNHAEDRRGVSTQEQYQGEAGEAQKCVDQVLDSASGPAPGRKKRGPPRCSNCFQLGHTCWKCPKPSGDAALSDILGAALAGVAREEGGQGQDRGSRRVTPKPTQNLMKRKPHPPRRPRRTKRPHRPRRPTRTRTRQTRAGAVAERPMRRLRRRLLRERPMRRLRRRLHSGTGRSAPYKPGDLPPPPQCCWLQPMQG
jgi:hypothetical protein